MNLAEIELSNLKQLNTEISSGSEKNDDFLKVQQSKIEEIKEKKQKAIDEFTQQRNSFVSNMELLKQFSENLNELIKVVGEDDIIDNLRKKQTEITEIQEKIETIDKEFDKLFVNQYKIGDILSKEKMSLAEIELKNLKELNESMSRTIATNETFLKDQKPKINEIKENQNKKAIADIEKKIEVLEAQKTNLQEIGSLINDDIAGYSPKINESAKKAKMALEGLVLAVNEKISEDVKTPAEKSFLLGPILLYFRADSYEARQKAHALTSQINTLSVEINEAIGNCNSSDFNDLKKSAGSLFTSIDKINTLCEKNGILDEKFDNKSANFNDLAAALTAKIPNYMAKNDNVRDFEEASKELVEAEKMKASLVAEKDKLVEMKNGIGNDAQNKINSVSVEFQSR